MGWSYGGPIAVKMDVLNHDIIKHIVLIAPAISPKDEKFFALGKVAKWGITKWMVPKPFRVAEAEKMSHVKELQLMLPDWSQIKTPISYYQGDNDHIVPYANTQFIKTHVSSKFLEVTTIKEGSHFIAFKNYDLIKAKLLQILKNLSKNP
jgi:pimeloyl-ACP methyl ester carboxylesterase